MSCRCVPRTPSSKPHKTPRDLRPELQHPAPYPRRGSTQAGPNRRASPASQQSACLSQYPPAQQQQEPECPAPAQPQQKAPPTKQHTPQPSSRLQTPSIRVTILVHAPEPLLQP